MFGNDNRNIKITDTDEYDQGYTEGREDALKELRDKLGFTELFEELEEKAENMMTAG